MQLRTPVFVADAAGDRVCDARQQLLGSRQTGSCGFEHECVHRVTIIICLGIDGKSAVFGWRSQRGRIRRAKGDFARVVDAK